MVGRTGGRVTDSVIVKLVCRDSTENMFLVSEEHRLIPYVSMRFQKDNFTPGCSVASSLLVVTHYRTTDEISST